MKNPTTGREKKGRRFILMCEDYNPSPAATSLAEAESALFF